MSLRSWRMVAVLCGFATLLPVMVGAAARAGAKGDLSDSALARRCAAILLGVGHGPATPQVGSADPQVISQFALFRRARSRVDALPAAPAVRGALAAANARTYDPSAAVRLSGRRPQVGEFAVPATMARARWRAACDRLPRFAGARVFLAREAQLSGTGPGVCVIWTQTEKRQPTALPLPGQRHRPPTKTLVVEQANCLSNVALVGYRGAIGNSDPFGASRALIPDGVSTVTYTLANHDTLSVPVHGNVATAPAVLTAPSNADLSRYRAALSSHLPTSVTERAAAQTVVRTLTRPTALIPDVIDVIRFLKRRLATGGQSGSSSGTSLLGASCSARTHRCVAATVTTTCEEPHPCQMTRTIHRYRYVGVKPPAGTTGQQPIDLTAPIVARTNRRIVSPGKLELVLSGTPHRSVIVVQSSTCFTRNSTITGDGAPLEARVPSRSRIFLGGPGGGALVCDVSALVISRERGRVHITVSRARAPQS